MTHPKLQRLNDLAKDDPAGPWVPCRANEDTCGCACGQIWSEPLDHPVATAHKEDDDFQTSPVNTIATMRFISEANPDTIQKLIQALDICRTALTQMGFGMNSGDSPKIRDEAFLESGRILDSIGDQ